MASTAGVARKTALITGASSGIGYELAKLFARDHFDLVLVARDPSRLERAADELRRTFGITATVKATDLSRPAAATRIYRQLQDEGIEIDVLVNNAGFNVYGPFSETNAQRELGMIQTNVIALTQLTKELLPGMIERRSGKILNLGRLEDAIVVGAKGTIFFSNHADRVRRGSQFEQARSSAGLQSHCPCGQFQAHLVGNLQTD